MDQRIRGSWEANASLWTRAVREAWIPSRRAGTDHAILEAVLRESPGRLLDLGCGEGWLARILAAAGWDVEGVDSGAALVQTAQAAGGGTFRRLSYEDIESDPGQLRGPYDAAVCNFAQFSEKLGPLLAAILQVLRPGGRLIVQTVHPREACGEMPYENGWRLETFAGFGEGQWEPMLWYFRTAESRQLDLIEAGFQIEQSEEPLNPETGRPLSMLITCRKVYPQI
jgi:2-polyprenyl-3-methyl-5-hydroxy-6-metoxy-1,4-benzoquinol methylase